MSQGRKISQLPQKTVVTGKERVPVSFQGGNFYLTLQQILNEVSQTGGIPFFIQPTEPTAVGPDGAGWINSAQADYPLYRRVNSNWIFVGNLRGPQGLKGDQGDQGLPAAPLTVVNVSYDDSLNTVVTLSDSTSFIVNRGLKGEDGDSGDPSDSPVTSVFGRVGVVVAQSDDYADFYVMKSGGIMTGYLELYADPVNPMHGATKQYVDSIPRPLSFETLLGDSVNISHTIEHGLGTEEVFVSFKLTGEQKQSIELYWRVVDSNNILVSSGSPLLTNEVKTLILSKPL